MHVPAHAFDAEHVAPTLAREGTHVRPTWSHVRSGAHSAVVVQLLPSGKGGAVVQTPFTQRLPSAQETVPLQSPPTATRGAQVPFSQYAPASHVG